MVDIIETLNNRIENQLKSAEINDNYDQYISFSIKECLIIRDLLLKKYNKEEGGKVI